MKRKTKKRSLATPDLTPLIDVVFLLLIFFMLVTTFDKYTGLNIELPKGKADVLDTPKINELVIDADEKYYVIIDNKKEEILKENLGDRLVNIKEITITADKNLKYEIIVKAIGALKTIGVDKVELNFYE